MGFIVPGKNNRSLTKRKRVVVNEHNIEKFVFFHSAPPEVNHKRKKQLQLKNVEVIDEERNKETDLQSSTVAAGYNILNIPLDITLKIVSRVNLNDIKISSKALYHLTLISLKNNFTFYKTYVEYHFYSNEQCLLKTLYLNAPFMDIFIEQIKGFADEYLIDEDYREYYKITPNKQEAKKEFDIRDPHWNPVISIDAISKLLEYSNKELLARWLFLPFIINKMVRNPLNYFKFTFLELYKELRGEFLNKKLPGGLFTPLYNYYIMAKDYLDLQTGNLCLQPEDYARYVEIFIGEILPDPSLSFESKKLLFVDSVCGKWAEDGSFIVCNNSLPCYEQEKVWLDIYNLRFNQKSNDKMKSFSSFMEQFLLNIKSPVKDPDSDSELSFINKPLLRPNIMHLIVL